MWLSERAAANCNPPPINHCCRSEQNQQRGQALIRQAIDPAGRFT
jgi:hypothetical protein